MKIMQKEIELKNKINSQVSGLSAKSAVDFILKQLEGINEIEAKELLFKMSNVYSQYINKIKTTDGKTIDEVIKTANNILNTISEIKRISDELDRVGLNDVSSSKKEYNFQFCN